jgi:type IV pilus assembly protein PilM
MSNRVVTPIKPGFATADLSHVPMAKRTKNLVGLDIDPTGLTAVEVAVNGRITVNRAAAAPLEPGILREGEIVDVAGLADALRALWKENKGLGRQVRVGLASQKIVVRIIEMPVIADPKELATAVQFQAQDQLPMPLDSAVLDFQPLDVVDNGEGPRQRVLLVAARREMVDRVLAAVRGAGLNAGGIDLSAFAMVRALHREGDDADPVLYMAIGGLTNLAVATGTNCLFTRAAGGGLEALAIELAERQALTLEHSRAWLEHVGLEEPLEEVDGDADIVREARRVLLDGVRRIAADVRNTLDFHSAQGGGAAVTRAVLTGPAAAVPGFAAAMGAELGIRVDAGIVDGAPAAFAPGRLTIAAGLAVSEAPGA